MLLDGQVGVLAEAQVVVDPLPMSVKPVAQLGAGGVTVQVPVVAPYVPDEQLGAAVVWH